jgi:hypothetical protein
MNEETKIEVPGNWLQVDFHVHSPSSFDFQGIGKDESGYIWLLEQAKTAGIDIVVITDHNDIAGYLKLMEIESDLNRTKRTLERTNSQIPESVLKQISLFEDVAILPAVELDVYPNLHILILFDPQKVDEISIFLNNAGYTKDVRGEENSYKSVKWNFEQTLQEAEKIGAIAIAAHVDSDKGLYDSTKKWGFNRASAFCNENLYGMEFINPIARDQIESILKDPTYARNSRLAFVQSSDFHGKPEQKIGERSTFVRMDNVEKHDKNSLFQVLKKALRDPDEFISAPGRPELQAILKRLTDKPSIENINSDEEKKRLIQWVCAYSNTEDGTVIIGRNSKGNWTGQFENSEKDFAKKIHSAIVSSIEPSPRVTLQVYPYYGNNYIATIRVEKHHQICSLISEDKVYVLKSGKPKQATSKEIVDMAESRFIERYSHLSITSRLSEMSQKLLGTEDSIDILPIVRKIEKNSIPLRAIFRQPVFGAVTSNEQEEAIEMSGNGYVDGAIISAVSAKPRFDKHYLRISAPISKYEGEINTLFDKKFCFSGEKIIVVPGGGIYYDNHQNIAITGDVYPPMIFTEENKKYAGSFKFLVAFLKSSVSIWYAERCLGSSDIRNVVVSQDLPIPNTVDMSCQEAAEKLIDEILKLEFEFLNAEKHLLNEFPSKEDREGEEFEDLSSNLTHTHNENANNLIAKLDKLFYEFFGFTNKEVSMIEQALKSSEFAVFDEVNLEQ